MKIASVAVRGMKSHGSKVRDGLRNICPDEPPDHRLTNYHRDRVEIAAESG